MGWFTGEPARFRSRLSPDECVQRLERHVSSRWAFLADMGFTGQVSIERLAIGRKYMLAHNGYQTWFVGRMQESADGTEIIGTFRITRAALIGTIIWMSWFLIIGGTGTIVGTDQIGGHLLFAGFTAGLMLVGMTFLRFARWLARNDKRIISAMLVDALLAERIS